MKDDVLPKAEHFCSASSRWQNIHPYPETPAYKRVLYNAVDFGQGCFKQNIIVLPVTNERLFIKLWILVGIFQAEHSCSAISRTLMFCQKQNPHVLPKFKHYFKQNIPVLPKNMYVSHSVLPDFVHCISLRDIHKLTSFIIHCVPPRPAPKHSTCVSNMSVIKIRKLSTFILIKHWSHCWSHITGQQLRKHPFVQILVIFHINGRTQLVGRDCIA